MKKTVLFGLLIIVLAFSFIGCGDGNGNNNNVNSAVLAQLVGEWNKGEQRISFSGNAQLAIIDIWVGTIDNVLIGLITNILSITTDKVTYGNPSFGVAEESFNFVISGNTLIVTNWSVTAQAGVMNGTYTRSQD